MLEEFIRNNREKLESEEPDIGHLKRFQKRLSERQMSKKRTIRTIFEYAAIASVIVFFTAIIVYQNKQASPNIAQIKDSQLNNEFNEASYYYETEINQQYSTLIQHCLEDNPEEISDLQNDIALLNSDYKQLKDEYNENPHDERLQSAIIMVYKQKLAILKLVQEKTCKMKN